MTHISDPCFSRIIQSEDKSLPRGIDQADDLGAFALISVDSRNIGHQSQRIGIENLYAAGGIVGCCNQVAILGNSATDTVAGLHNALDQFPFKQINLGQAAITSEYIDITFIT